MSDEGRYETVSESAVALVGPGFGTMRLQVSAGTGPPPPSASARAYLREGLPALYQDDPLAMAFVGALEGSLDPIVALLDNLPAHLDADLASSDMLELLMAWLGQELPEAQPVAERREVVRRAPELGRKRGTRAGLELALKLAFPDVPLRVQDAGGVRWGAQDADDAEVPPPSFVVLCDKPLAIERQAAVARLIEKAKPAHVSYRLRVRAG